MENMKVSSGGGASPKRREPLRASPKHREQQKAMMSNVLEAIARVNGRGSDNINVSATNDNGVVRMKIMVRKQDLKQILQLMKNGAPSSTPASSSFPSVEQRPNILRRKHILRAVNSGKEDRRRCWRHELLSIPEEP